MEGKNSLDNIEKESSALPVMDAANTQGGDSSGYSYWPVSLFVRLGSWKRVQAFQKCAGFQNMHRM